jgi:predicted TIM-barrel fold metal-dependent hydrolase
MSKARCDSHVHVVGAIGRYPQMPTRAYLADLAPLEELQRVAAECAISRLVIVQPSFYGADNTLLLESLRQLGPLGRGVVVIDPVAMTPERLADHAALGVRGLRVNLYSTLEGQERRLDRAFAACSDIAREMGWHIEVIAPIDMLVENFDLLQRASVPVVIDHYGVFRGLAPESAQGQRLLALVRQPHVWMKLSAPYRSSSNALETHPDRAWLAAYLAVAADRCVWGSDWPHTPPHEAQHGADIKSENRPLTYSRVLDDFVQALPAPDIVDRILIDNPDRLYGFSG